MKEVLMQIVEATKYQPQTQIRIHDILLGSDLPNEVIKEVINSIHINVVHYEEAKQS